MALPLQHLDVAAIETISTALWTSLFARIGWPGSLVADGFDDHSQLLEALHADEAPSPELLQALECLRTLGTDRGREAILEAAADRRVRLDWVDAEVGAQELAVQLYLRQLDNAGMQEVYARAQLHLHETDTTRKIHELDGKRAAVPHDVPGVSGRLAEQMRAFCLRKGLGSYVQVRMFEDDGALVFHVVHSHHLRTPLAVTQEGRGVIGYRPVHDDILRFDAATGRLRIVARSSRLAGPYAKMAGTALFADPAFFGGEVWNLRPLQEHKGSLFERHDVPEVGRIWMTECTWVRGDRERHCLYGRDCFETIEELRLPITDGKLTRVKLKMRLTGRKAGPVTVVLTPRDCTISDASHDHLINRCLERLGLRAGGNAAPELDFWGLRPWTHRRDVWFALFGRRTDALIESGVLSPAQLDALPHPDLAMESATLEVHPLPGSDYYGVGVDEDVPARTLSATELDALALAPPALAALLQQELSLTGHRAPWTSGSDLLDLGELPLGEVRFRLVYLVGPPLAELGLRVRRLAGVARPALLVPASRSIESDLCWLRLDEPIPSLQHLRRAVAMASGMADELPAIDLADPGARLVIDTRFGRMWFEGVPVPLREDVHAFQLALALARARPEPVDHTALATLLNGARTDENTVVRQAKSAANKAIRQALAEAGKDRPDDPFPTAGVGTYRCAVRAFVR